MNQIIGLDKLTAQLKHIANLDLEQALLAGGKPVLDEMNMLTPVDKGDLLASEGMEVSGDTLEIFAGTDHALPVEFGTIYTEAQSFMRAAVDTKSGDAVRAMAENVNKQLKDIANG